MRFIYLRFLGYLLPLSSLVFALGFASYEWVSYRDSLDDLQTEIESELATASIILAEPTYHQDKRQVRLVIASILSHPNIIGAEVTNVDGEVIDSFGANEQQGNWRSTRINFSDESSFMEVGTLSLGYSTESLVAGFQIRVLYTLLLGIGLLSLVILTAWWAYSRTVGIPISRLHEAIGSRLKGDDYEPVEWESNDELGIVISEYNEMQKKLQEQENSSRTYQANLQEAIGRQTEDLVLKTRELTSINDQLTRQNNERIKAQQALAYSNEVLKMTSEMLSENEVDNKAFYKVCKTLWQASGSKLVFMAEVELLPDGSQAMDVLGVHWETTKEERLAFLENNEVETVVPVPTKDEFLEAVYDTKQPVISEDLKNDPRSTNPIPGGFPEMREFMMVPLLDTRDEIIGILGLANREGGYDQALIDDLAPLLSSVSSLMIACDNVAMRQLAESSMLLRQKQLAWQQEVLAELEMQLVNPDIDEEDYLYRLIAMRACKVANLQHTSIWELQQDKLECIIEYDAGSNQFSNEPSFDEAEIKALQEHLLNSEKTPPGKQTLILPVTIDKHPRGALVFAQLPADLSADISIFLSAVSGIVNVIFERKIRGTVEDQLRQSQKMTAIGRLAGGIAHDFNNLLTNIMGYVELAKMQSDGQSAEHLDIALSNSKRAAELTDQLLTFSKKQVISPANLDASATIARALSMIRSLLRSDVRLQYEQSPDLPRIRFDKSQFDQVMLNLCINAQDAMERSGDITIKATTTDAESETALSTLGAAANRYLKLSVSDNGQGISDKDLPHIFDPFFTTKDEKNSGLGLATVYSLIEQGGGYITVESEPDSGTTFLIYIPEERIEEAEPNSVVLEPTENPVNSATILIAEDEPAVRQLVANILEAEGHTVLEAPDGPSALEAVATYDSKIDLLLTDMVMPGMNGKQLAEKFKAQYPETRILYMSGFVSDATLDDYEQTNLFLQKPFVPNALIEKVNAVLAETPVQRSA